MVLPGLLVCLLWACKLADVIVFEGQLPLNSMYQSYRTMLVVPLAD